MFKVGDSVFYKGGFYGKITEVNGSVYKVYVVDSKGGVTYLANEHELILQYSTSNTNIEKETVAKPKRYNSGSIEVWDAIQQLGADYLQGNVIKYTMRYKHKNGAEDLKKAVNYLAKMLAEETGEDYYELRKKSLDEL